MKRISFRSLAVIVVALLFCAGLGLFYGRLALVGDAWATYPTNRHLYKDGHLVKAGEITDRDGTVLAYTRKGTRYFHEDVRIRQATAHTVGDLDGFVSTGVHSAFLNELTGYDLINGTYNMSGEGHDMRLTVDADLSVTACQALGKRAGTVGIYNYKTGEILCMVSTPTFDPASETGLAEEKGVYVNRLLSGSYAPGSIFKLVTALSALENLDDVASHRYTCARGVTIGGEWLSCLGNHGKVDLESALVKSCNAAFAQFALTLGRSRLTKTAEKVGFNQTLTMDGIACTQSCYQVEKSNDIDFGWSGIGQHNDTVNPFQFLTFMGGIAGGGTCVWPYLVEDISSFSGTVKTMSNGKRVSMMSKDAAATLSDMMRKDVTDHYGDGNFAGLELCAKTGTAEIGDQSTPHSWFVGFCRAPDKPYAFVVVVENAGAGLGVASNIAARVLKAAPEWS